VTVGGGLRGRQSECDELDRLLAAAQAGESAVLVLRGEVGVGKTALLDYLVDRASGCRVVRAQGDECEMELAYAGLQQLCAAFLGRLDRLPAPQRAALATAFGLDQGEPPDRFMVGLAVLGLMSEVAEEMPTVCVVDDAQWLDRASIQALAFVARRLLAERVLLVFAVREPNDEQELSGLPELGVSGLSDRDARALLDSVIGGPVDERVRDRIVAETRGNPLALLELPRGLTPAELAGGFALPDALALTSSIEKSFCRQVSRLPSATRLLVLIAASEPLGDPVAVWRAADYLAIDIGGAAPPAAGLVDFGARVRFRHPLARSAVYRAASPDERRAAHGALAHVSDPCVEPDRRAWHRAQASSGVDEEIAAELDRSAGRARARGGLAAEAAFRQRAAELTPDPARRTERALAAAQAKHAAGAPDAAAGLLAIAEAGQLDELGQARVDMLRGRIAFASGRGGDAASLLLRAATRLHPLDPRLARDTYLEAFSAAQFAGQMATNVGVPEVARAARGAPQTHPRRACDILLDGLAVRFTDGYAAGVPLLRRALAAFRREEISTEDELRWMWLPCRASVDLWDDETWDVLGDRHVKLARQTGALTVLPLALSMRVCALTFMGGVAAAAPLTEEVQAAAEATGSQLPPYGSLIIAAFRGPNADGSELIQATIDQAQSAGQAVGVGAAHWASAVLHNGAGRYREAMAAALDASRHHEEMGFCNWSLAELILAAVRCGEFNDATTALEKLSAITRASATDWALGVEARSRALLSDGDTADRLYLEAIERLAATRIRVELARAHLLYGEWLRVERRRADARRHLQIAHGMFTTMGIALFAERAERELLAAGVAARAPAVKAEERPPGEALETLTAQEARIARMARDGLSNPEIGAQLFISPRTVKYHLSKVFTKLGLSSRRELALALQDS
jgi:DNA-binding CsgD family transcriptional regulator